MTNGDVGGPSEPDARARPLDADLRALATLLDVKAALEHQLAGRPAQAEALYRQILRREPNHPDALYFLGVMAQQDGRHAAAVDYILGAVAADPSNPRYYNSLGNALKDTGRLDEAAARYRQALALRPDYPEALFNLGNVSQRRRRFEEAVVCYRRALELKPDYAEALNDLGAAQMAQGKPDEAADSLQRALACRPDYAEAHNNLGVAHKNRGRIDAALACYRRAIEIDPGHAQALFNLGTVYFMRKDFTRAAAWYRASLAADPHQVEAHQNMAIILADAGYPDEARYHRDLAYRRQALFVDAAPAPARTVLVLWAADRGNVPVEFLLPVKSYTRIVWMMEYATEEQARALPDYDLVFNAVGDQDAAGPSAASVARFLRERNRKPVLNHPAAVARTARDAIPELLAPIPGVVVPRTVRLGAADLERCLPAAPGIRMPVLLRPAGSHGGARLVKAESAFGLSGLAASNAGGYYATNYHDYRSDDGYYRKYRMIFVDRRPYPCHLAVGKHWMVHYETAAMLAESWKTAEEASFLEDPEGAIGTRAMAAVAAIGRKLDLDYCGLDFSILPDGRVLVFEANATMLVHPEDEHGVLRFKNRFVRRILAAFDDLATRACGGRFTLEKQKSGPDVRGPLFAG